MSALPWWAVRLLLLTPPMTQLNTPYPATAYLTGFLRKNGIETVQADPAIELVLRLFSKTGIREIAEEILDKGPTESQSIRFFLENKEQYLDRVESVIRFLQNKDPSLALRIVSRTFLPEGPRFAALDEGATPGDPDPISWAFGSLGVQDRAKYLASL